MFNKEIKKNVHVIHQVIEKEEVVEYNVNYCEVNYEYEHVKEVDYVKNKSYLVDDGNRHVEIVEIIEEKKVVDSEYIVVEEKKAECCKVEGQKMMKQNGLEYEEIKKLMSVIIKKRLE